MMTFLVCVSLPAQERNIVFRHLTMEQGLLSNEINCIAQDSLGFMWFGSKKGLDRFDGYQIISFTHNPQDPSSLPEGGVKKIIIDDDGNLWVAGNGLSRFDPRTWKFSNYQYTASQTPEPNILITDVIQTQPDTFWITTNGDGLLSFDRKTKKFSKPGDSPAWGKDLGFLCLFPEGDNIWIGGESGLFLFDTRRNQLITNNEEFSLISSALKTEINDIESTRDGKLLIATRFDGLIIFDPASGYIKIYNEKEGKLLNNNVIKIFPDSNGDIWLATQGGGLNRFHLEKEEFNSFIGDPYQDTSINSYMLSDIFRDQEGVIWVSGTGGVDRFNPKTKVVNIFRSIMNNQSNDNNEVLSVLKEERYLWVGTRTGLNRFSTGEKSLRIYNNEVRTLDGIPPETCYTIIRTNSGELWVGSKSNIYRYNKRNDSFTPVAEIQKSAFLRKGKWPSNIFEDSKGDIWVSFHYGGITHLNRRSGTIKDYYFDDIKTEFPFWRGFYSVSETRDGKILFNSQQEGIFVSDPLNGSLQHIDVNLKSSSGLKSGHILSAFQDSRGLVWLSTFGAGVALFNVETGEFRHFARKDGLPSDEVYCVVEDDLGKLWLSTNNGIARLTIEGKEKDIFKIQPVITNYSTGLGAMGNEFNMGAFNKGPDGNIYFGGIAGVFVVNPSEEKKDSSRFSPELVFTDFRIKSHIKAGKSLNEHEVFLGRIVNTVDSLGLEYNESYINIDFSLLSYSNPEKNQYSYIMEGFGNEWVELGTRHSLDFSLPPGSYTLKIRGRMQGLDWEEKIRSLKIEVFPPFWESNYFRAAVVLFLFLTVLFLHQARTRTIRRRNEELSKINERLNREITNRQKTEESLREAQQDLQTQIKEISDLNKHLEAFDYSVSNALRVPLRHAEGYANIIQDNFSGGLETKVVEYLNRIGRSISDSRELVDNLLRLSRASRQDLMISDINLSKLAEKALERALAEHNVSNVTITIEENLICKGDFHLLLNVMTSLIDNAVKYTKTVADPAIKFGCVVEQFRKIYFVEDNGVGFDQERSRTIFEPFHAYHTDVSFEGVGLSLATVERIINRHNGRIWAESSEGNGSKFFFTIDE